ncbi:MAG: glycosyltransferase, partial [Clostridia bacterium]|nr:glycosyltransferase [Clostridia bacterium]
MKVLLISPVPPPTGGITRWSETVLNEISHRKDVELSHINISPRYRGDLTIFKRVFFGVFGLFGVMRRLSKELKTAPDVIHLTTSGGLALFRDNAIAKKAVKRGVPLVIHLHYGRVPETFSQNCRERKRLKRVLNAAAKVIAIDDETFSALSDNGFAEKSVFCPNPIKVDEISKKQIPYASRDNKVVFLGHVLKTKGIE